MALWQRRETPTRLRKKSFNEHLTPREQWIQKIPTFPFVITVAVLIIILTFVADKKTNLSSWRPHLGEVSSKTLNILLDNAETIAIVTAAVLYLKEAPARKDQRHYEAWKIIDNAHKVSTSYARIKALQDLNSDGISFKGLDASDANLEGIQLQGADLRGANLRESNLKNANFEGTKLWEANLEGAHLQGANLRRSELESANLTGADLGFANLQEAHLYQASLDSARMENANLSSANLECASLNGAYLTCARLEGAYLLDSGFRKAFLAGTDFKGAYMENANLEGANLWLANLQEVQGLKQDQLAQAKLCQTNLPNDITLDPNRDCEELGEELGMNLMNT
jgi:uncharacterized protein YjbI with pentapeptide repeats